MKPTDSRAELKRSVLIVAAFAAFLTPFMGAAVNLALPEIGRDLDANAIELNWVVTIYLLASAIFLLPFGRLGDIVGRKKIFFWGLILFTVSSFCVCFSTTISYLLAFRAIQGVSSAMIFGTSMAIITSVFPPGERGKAMGISITAVYIGLSSGPFLGGLLTQYFGWRSIFIFLVPWGLAAALLTHFKIKTEWADARNERLDIPGAILIGAGLVLTITGFSKLPTTTGLIMVGFGIVLIGTFFFYERIAAQPLLNIKLLTANRVFAFSNLAAMIQYSATSATGFFMSLYLQYLKGLDARTAGLILMTQPVIMALLSTPSGKLSDRINPGKMASAGIGLTAAGIVSFTFLSQNSPLSMIIVILIVMGVGYALFSTPNANAIMSSVEKRDLGVASGMLGTMRMVGQTMSLGIAMMLIALFIGQEKISPDNYPDLLTTIRTGFLILALLCIPAIFASLARNKRLNRIK